MAPPGFDYGVGIPARHKARPQGNDQACLAGVGAQGIPLGHDGIDEDVRPQAVNGFPPGVDQEGDLPPGQAGCHPLHRRLPGRHPFNGYGAGKGCRGKGDGAADHRRLGYFQHHHWEMGLPEAVGHPRSQITGPPDQHQLFPVPACVHCLAPLLVMYH